MRWPFRRRTSADAKPALARDAFGRPAIFPPRQPDAPPTADRAAFEAALALPDGAPADDGLLAFVAAETHDRRARVGLLDGPASPVATGLRIRHEGTPDWWREGGNLLLCGGEVGGVELALGFMKVKTMGSLVVVGSRATPPRITINSGPALVVLGDRAWINGGGISTNGPSTVLIGEDTSSTWLPSVSSFNGGMVLVGADGMWAPGVNFMTDDGHAVMDVASGKRINRYGGRIVVDAHVWLGFNVALSGDTYVGPNAVVGQGAIVKNARLPANSVCVGRPAKPVRSGTTWTREDVPGE